jgi:molecular chaperone DnaK (HSP70)
MKGSLQHLNTRRSITIELCAACLHMLPSQVKITVYEGERARVEDNSPLGTFELTGGRAGRGERSWHALLIGSTGVLTEGAATLLLTRQSTIPHVGGNTAGTA